MTNSPGSSCFSHGALSVFAAAVASSSAFWPGSNTFGSPDAPTGIAGGSAVSSAASGGLLLLLSFRRRPLMYTRMASIRAMVKTTAPIEIPAMAAVVSDASGLGVGVRSGLDDVAVEVP